MKTLILGSVLISSMALTSGCIIIDGDDSDQGAIGASWKIKTNDQVGACPPGFDTARVISRPFGRNDSAGDKIDLFNCSAGRGLTAPLQAGAYVVWVEITDNSGANVYAQSAPANVDITTADKDVSYDIHTDKGFYFMNWALQGKTTGAALQCGQVPSLSKIALDASTTVGQAPLSTTFDCLQEQGYSNAIAAGVYQLAVAGIDNQEAAVTDTTTIASKQVTAPNKFTDLGTVVILAPGQ